MQRAAAAHIQSIKSILSATKDNAGQNASLMHIENTEGTTCVIQVNSWFCK